MGSRKEEKAWFQELESGFIDCFRLFNSGHGYYTYWSRKKQKIMNKGYRFDYFLVNDN